MADSNAMVVNMSLGGAPHSHQEINDIAASTNQGKLLIIAEGNENNNNDQRGSFPESYDDPSIVAVVVLHGDGDFASFSNYGATTVDIASPGKDIVSTIPVGVNVTNEKNAYASFSGTSMACPMVAGATALLWVYTPEIDTSQIKAALLASLVTGKLSNPVAESQVIDIGRLLDEIKARATIGATSTIRPSSRISCDLGITTVSDYNYIEKIEIMHLEEIIGSSQGDENSIPIDLPLGFGTVNIFEKVIDSAGRAFTLEPVPLDLTSRKVSDLRR